ncbi:hypothetical protein ACLB2K_035176 [Fragaria x ananassa]
MFWFYTPVVQLKQSTFSSVVSQRSSKMAKPVAGKCAQEILFGILISSILCFLLLLFDYSTSFPGVNNGADYLYVNTKVQPTGIPKNKTTVVANQSATHSCSGRYVYIHDDLPDKFGKNLLNNCKSLTQGSDKPNMCPYLENFGFGPEINNSEGVLTNKSWYSSNQFALDVIFHSKMRQYECLTSNSTLASAVYIPIYAGLEDSLHLWDPNLTARDSFGIDFLKWVSSRPEWKKMWGRDHFFAVGRIAWDFRRKTDNNTDWGSKFRFLPESKNMTMLSIEGSSWTNDIAIPYPTGFHPTKESSAYNQYLWHLPKNHTKYSMFIPVKNVTDLNEVSIEKTLLGISKTKELAMREELIRLIPNLVYSDPMSRLETPDAFDIAVKRILERIENVRKMSKEGKDPSFGFTDEEGDKFKFNVTKEN